MAETVTEIAVEQPLEALMLKELITNCLNNLEGKNWECTKKAILDKLENNEPGEAVKMFVTFFSSISSDAARMHELAKSFTLLRYISSDIKDRAWDSNGLCFNEKHALAIKDLRDIISTLGSSHLEDWIVAQRISELDAKWGTSVYENYKEMLKDLKDA